MALEGEKIKRVEKVIGIGHCANLWEKAIDELTSIQDEQVTTLLADIAKNGETVALKTKAAEALWHNTANSGFKNIRAIDILRGLSSSSHEGVRWYAQEALRDYETNRSRISASSKETASEKKLPSFYQPKPR